MDLKQLNEKLQEFISLMEVSLKPYKFTVDYGDARPEDFIAYGVDAEDAKRDLYDEYSYLKKHDIKITNVEEVPEDHEEVEMPFTMIHKSSEGPDVSGTVRFIPAPFGYEYDCSVKEFNGKGPQWSTIRTIEGIKIWFRNVLFEFGAKTVTIGDETWDIDDFPKDDVNESLKEERKVKRLTRAEWNKTPSDYKMIKDGQKYVMYLDPQYGTVLGPCEIVDEPVNEGRSTQGHRQEILKEIDYDELAKKLIAKEGKEKLEKGIKKNNTKEYFYSLVGNDENIDPAALTDAIERHLDNNSIDEDYELTNEDMCNTIDEDRHDLLVAVEHCVNKFNSLSNKWDKEVQKMTFDRICEILETAEENLSNMAFRMGKMK